MKPFVLALLLCAAGCSLLDSTDKAVTSLRRTEVTAARTASKVGRGIEETLDEYAAVGSEAKVLVAESRVELVGILNDAHAVSTEIRQRSWVFWACLCALLGWFVRGLKRVGDVPPRPPVG